jgi:hypothetical protein
LWPSPWPCSASVTRWPRRSGLPKRMRRSPSSSRRDRCPRFLPVARHHRRARRHSRRSAQDRCLNSFPSPSSGWRLQSAPALIGVGRGRSGFPSSSPFRLPSSGHRERASWLAARAPGHAPRSQYDHTIPSVVHSTRSTCSSWHVPFGRSSSLCLVPSIPVPLRPIPVPLRPLAGPAPV